MAWFPAHRPPLRHVSAPVHLLPSSQALPTGLATGAGQPVAATHAPTVMQALPPEQVTVVPVQTPAWQASLVVHRLLSSQVVPFALATGAGQPVAATHVPIVWQLSVVHVIATGDGQPVAGTQAATVWHLSAGVQVTAVPVQTPA